MSEETRFEDARFDIEIGHIKVIDRTVTPPLAGFELEGKIIERDVSPQKMLEFLQGLSEVMGGRLKGQFEKLKPSK